MRIETRIIPRVVILGAALLGVACAPPAPPTTPTPTAGAATPRVAPAPSATSSTVWISHGGPIVDHVSFIDKLRGERCQVEPIGSVGRAALRGEGIVLRVSGCGLARPTTIESYWYHTDDLGTDGLRAAEEDAGQIAARPRARTPATTPTRYFRKERAFVIYAGDDPTLITILTRLLGPPFATTWHD